jgi:AcrR family transcriptional regulator
MTVSCDLNITCDVDITFPMPRRPRNGVPTDQRLREAAMAEFNDHGFAGTDTNRIARRAGFAPQTFYRWYADKTAIFIACYRAWEDEERAALQALIEARAPPGAFAEAGIQQHVRYLKFRRSLRALSLENAEVRRARAESRLRQIRQIQAWAGGGSTDDLAVTLLELERLTDAVAEGELSDMGLSEDAARAALAGLMRRVTTPA